MKQCQHGNDVGYCLQCRKDRNSAILGAMLFCFAVWTGWSMLSNG